MDVDGAGALRISANIFAATIRIRRRRLNTVQASIGAWSSGDL
jgi:hypothetical protein